MTPAILPDLDPVVVACYALAFACVGYVLWHDYRLRKQLREESRRMARARALATHGPVTTKEAA